MEENQKKKKKIPTIVWWLVAIVILVGFFLGPTVVKKIKTERYNKQVAEVEAVKEAWLQGMINHDVAALKKVFPRDKFYEKYGDNAVGKGKSDEAFYFDEFSLGVDINETSIAKYEDRTDEITIHGDKNRDEYARVGLSIRYGNGTEEYGCNVHLNISKDSEDNLYVASLGISKTWEISRDK